MNDSELKFDLPQSPYLQRRSELLNSSTLPTLSTTTENLGCSLAQTVFDECECALREEYGLEPSLKGAGNDLWISPSDLLIGKVVLKPPFTQKCMTALTHQGILEIGEKIEDQFLRAMELEKQKALEKLEAELLAAAEDRIRAEVKDAEVRERNHCFEEMERLEKEFELALTEELEKLEEKLKAEFEVILTYQKEMLEDEWQQKIEEEVQKTVELLTKQFLEKHEQQEKILLEEFEYELLRCHVHENMEIKKVQQKADEAMKQMTHRLECRNLSNMMYILCVERKKCNKDKKAIEAYYNDEIKKLKTQMEIRDQEIAQVKDERDKHLRDVRLRETCLQEIIRQYQKFINFALRAAPTQAEFLLSLEKMMVFELSDTAAKSKFSQADPEPGFLPWQYGQSMSTTTASSIKVNDYHDCLNEMIKPPRPDGDRFLPAMYFKNKMYIREDFRDILARGIKITPSNDLWNEDVEILMETLRSSVTDIHNEAVAEDYQKSGFTRHTRTSVQFDSEKPIRMGSDQMYSPDMSTRSFASTKKSQLKSFSPVDPIDFSKIGHKDLGPSLLAVSDSIELVLQKLRDVSSTDAKNSGELGDSTEVLPECGLEEMAGESYFTFEYQQVPDRDIATIPKCEGNEDLKSGELVLETKDSVIRQTVSLLRKSAEFSASPVDSIEINKNSLHKTNSGNAEYNTRASKLTSVKNSVMMLKESLYKLKEPTLHSPKQGSTLNTTESCLGKCTNKRNKRVLRNNAKCTKSDSLSHENAVKVTRIDVIPVETNVSPVSFKRPIEESFLTKPNELQIVGDMNAKEHLQTAGEFTADRIHSFVNIIKDHPNLIKLFTACRR